MKNEKGLLYFALFLIALSAMFEHLATMQLKERAITAQVAYYDAGTSDFKFKGEK